MSADWDDDAVRDAYAYLDEQKRREDREKEEELEEERRDWLYAIKGFTPLPDPIADIVTRFMLVVKKPEQCWDQGDRLIFWEEGCRYCPGCGEEAIQHSTHKKGRLSGEILGHRFTCRNCDWWTVFTEHPHGFTRRSTRSLSVDQLVAVLRRRALWQVANAVEQSKTSGADMVKLVESGALVRDRLGGVLTNEDAARAQAILSARIERDKDPNPFIDMGPHGIPRFPGWAPPNLKKPPQAKPAAKPAAKK